MIIFIVSTETIVLFYKFIIKYIGNHLNSETSGNILPNEGTEEETLSNSTPRKKKLRPSSSNYVLLNRHHSRRVLSNSSFQDYMCDKNKDVITKDTNSKDKNAGDKSARNISARDKSAGDKSARNNSLIDKCKIKNGSSCLTDSTEIKPQIKVRNHLRQINFRSKINSTPYKSNKVAPDYQVDTIDSLSELTF